MSKESDALRRQLNTPWEELTQDERDAWNAIEEVGIGCDPMTAPDKLEGLIAGGEQVRAQASHNTPPAEEDRGLTLRQAAERLMELSSKIDRASTEDEENRLCDERDKLLAMMRKADALLSSPRVEGVRREALEQIANLEIDINFMADHLVWAKGLARAALATERKE